MAPSSNAKTLATAPLLPSTTANAPVGVKWTVDEALSHIGKGRFQSLVFFILGFAYMADAAEMLLLSYVVPDVKCEWNLTSTQQSLVTMVVFLGMASGSVVFGSVSDFFGRKPAVVMDIGLSAIAGLLSAVSPNVIWFSLFRFLVGMGLGGFILTSAMLAEFLPLEKRGRTLCGYQMFWSFGAILETLLAWAVMPHYQWRGLIFVSSIPLVVLLCIMPLLPESPRYLLVHGKESKARDVLALVARMNGTSLPEDMELTVTIPASTSASSNWPLFFDQFRTLFSYPLSRITPALWVSWISAALGYYGIILLTTVIHADDEEDDNLCSGDHVEFTDREYLDIFIDSLAEIPGVLFIMFTIDHFGRKKVLLLSWLGFAISMFLLPISSALQTTLLFAARFFTASGFDLVVVMASELYPSTCRSFAVGMGNLFSRFGGAISPFVAQGVYDAYGLTAVAIFHAVLFVFVAASTWLIPIEKAGLEMTDTIEDVIEELHRMKESHNSGQPFMP